MERRRERETDGQSLELYPGKLLVKGEGCVWLEVRPLSASLCILMLPMY